MLLSSGTRILSAGGIQVKEELNRTGGPTSVSY
jgi:hypothetical protein